MKHLRFIFSFIFFLISYCSQAQQNHFIYIQTDNKQPFYIKVDKKIYSSSISGYLVVPKLKTGDYNFVVGFPKNEWPEQNIHCSVEDKDLGYLLKDFGDKGWGFFNLQSLNVLMANDGGKNTATVAESKPDTFSNMLSTAVNDPVIKQKEPVKVEKKVLAKDEEVASATPAELSKDSSKIISKKDSLPVVKLNEVSPKDIQVVTASVNEKSAVVPAQDSLINKAPVKEKVNVPEKDQVSESLLTIKKGPVHKTSEGIEMSYIDMTEEIPDTIKIFISSDKINAENHVAKTTDTSKITQVKEEIKEPEVKPVYAEQDKKEIKIPAATQSLTIPAPTPIQQIKLDTVQQNVHKSFMVNSDCQSFATEEDFFKLRKKMAAVNSTDDMIMAAKKVFKSKCFTTEQVKNLAVLFLKDADKYSFFDAAYPYASDSYNYQQLQGQLTDTYYIDRFKAMIRH